MHTLFILLYIVLALIKSCYSASEERTLKALHRIHLEISYTSSVFEIDFLADAD